MLNSSAGIDWRISAQNGRRRDDVEKTSNSHDSHVGMHSPVLIFFFAAILVLALPAEPHHLIGDLP
jgi:hypothetical protein